MLVGQKTSLTDNFKGRENLKRHWIGNLELNLLLHMAYSLTKNAKLYWKRKMFLHFWVNNTLRFLLPNCQFLFNLYSKTVL